MSIQNNESIVVAENRSACDESVCDVNTLVEDFKSEKKFTNANTSCVQNDNLSENISHENGSNMTAEYNISSCQQFAEPFHFANEISINGEHFASDNEDTLYASDFNDTLHPLSERWSPVGANYEDTISGNESELSPASELELLSLADSPKARERITNGAAEILRIQSMEEEQELLTSSLLALTSHFAHVQLRVRQIVEAESDERDQLLKDLNEFAFKGIPDPMTTIAGSSKLDIDKEEDVNARQRQCELIEHLKSQLCELEKIAYESGAPVLPQHILLEKQKVIIDELKNKLNLKVEDSDLPQLTSEQLKSQVDNAIGEFVGPLKMKDQLVAQLKTQITDLERFIAFLQCDSDDQKLKSLSSSSEKYAEAYNSYAAKKKNNSHEKKFASRAYQSFGKEDLPVDSLKPASSFKADSDPKTIKQSLNSKAHGLMDKASLLMQIFATTQFGAHNDAFQKNKLKKTSKGNHWGDLRAQLEVDIQEIASLAATLSFDREKLKKFKRTMKNSLANNANGQGTSSVTTVQPTSKNIELASRALKPYAISSDSDEDTYDCYEWTQNVRKARYKGDSLNAISRELTSAVRKNFALTLLQLMQHGLRGEATTTTTNLMIPFLRCFNPHSPNGSEFRSTGTEEFVNHSSFMTNDASNVSCRGNECDEDYNNCSGYDASSNAARSMHAWELIMEYYCLKNGDEYNNTPARKLSQSFNLEIFDSKTVSAKQNLLTTIGNITAMHRPYKRSYNAHFKAFVCAGLNSHQLVEWLNLIFSCSDLIEAFYTENSYVMRTGFRDSLRSIDILTKYDFDLPVDLAIRHFKNI